MPVRTHVRLTVIDRRDRREAAAQAHVHECRTAINVTLGSGQGLGTITKR
jgi:hypothetical protein